MKLSKNVWQKYYTLLRNSTHKKVNISFSPANIQRFLDYIKIDKQLILVEWGLRNNNGIYYTTETTVDSSKDETPLHTFLENL